MIIVKKFFATFFKLFRASEQYVRPSAVPLGLGRILYVTQDLRPGPTYSISTELAFADPALSCPPVYRVHAHSTRTFRWLRRNDGFSSTCDERSEAGSAGDPRIAHHIGLFAESFCLALRALGVCFPASSGVGLSEDLE